MYMKYVYENSTCHVLDKNDLSAQTECGIGSDSDWIHAVNYKFLFDNYPFLQDSEVKKCIEYVFPQSIYNIYGSYGYLTKLSATLYVLLFLTYLLM